MLGQWLFHVGVHHVYSHGQGIVKEESKLQNITILLSGPAEDDLPKFGKSSFMPEKWPCCLDVYTEEKRKGCDHATFLFVHRNRHGWKDEDVRVSNFPLCGYQMSTVHMNLLINICKYSFCQQKDFCSKVNKV